MMIMHMFMSFIVVSQKVSKMRHCCPGTGLDQEVMGLNPLISPCCVSTGKEPRERSLSMMYMYLSCKNLHHNQCTINRCKTKLLNLCAKLEFIIVLFGWQKCQESDRQESDLFHLEADFFPGTHNTLNMQRLYYT